MDITFEGKCPQCKQEIVIHIVAKTEEERQVSKEVKDMEAYTFDLMNQASQEAWKNRDKKGSKHAGYVNSYFADVERQIKQLTDLKQLAEKNKELARTRIVANKTIRKNVAARKKRAFALIKRRRKELTKKRRQRRH